MLKIAGAVVAVVSVLFAVWLGASIGESDAAFSARTSDHPEGIRLIASVFNSLAVVIFSAIAFCAAVATVASAFDGWRGEPSMLFIGPPMLTLITGMMSTSDIWPRWMFLAASVLACAAVGMLLARSIWIFLRPSVQQSPTLIS